MGSGLQSKDRRANGEVAGESARIQKFGLGIWIRLALILLAVAVGAWGLRQEKAILSKPSPATGAKRTLVRAELGIEGMDCLMCAAGLQNKLRALPGVSKAEVSYQDKRARIEFDPALFAHARLVEAIVGEGFKVVAQDPSVSPSNPPPSRAR